MNQEKVIVIDFGGQYNQLVARRVRECNVYCEIYSYRTPLEEIKKMKLKARETAIKYDSVNTKDILINVFT